MRSNNGQTMNGESSMGEEMRLEQYRRKLEFISDKISRLPEEPGNDEFYWDALFYRLQISIDACMDIIAMLCKDLGVVVGDDHSNIDELISTNIMDPEILRAFHGLNGLRNVLVHRYNKIENDLVIAEKDDVVSTITRFLTSVEEIINARFTTN